VASADLIEEYWSGLTCTGPLSATPGDPVQGSGPCKRLFQNWLAKIVYHAVSEMASSAQNNRGAAGTNTAAYIADYLWDRNDVLLVHRNPTRINGGAPYLLTPAQAYARAKELALDRMNGYGVHLGQTSSCDYFAAFSSRRSTRPSNRRSRRRASSRRTRAATSTATCPSTMAPTRTIPRATSGAISSTAS
jgi:hypothetical protein